MYASLKSIRAKSNNQLNTTSEKSLCIVNKPFEIFLKLKKTYMYCINLDPELPSIIQISFYPTNYLSILFKFPRIYLSIWLAMSRSKAFLQLWSILDKDSCYNHVFINMLFIFNLSNKIFFLKNVYKIRSRGVGESIMVHRPFYMIQQ